MDVRRRADVHVSEAPVARQQVRSEIDDVNVDGAAAGVPDMALGGVDEPTAQTGTLPRPIDRQHPERPARRR